MKVVIEGTPEELRAFFAEPTRYLGGNDVPTEVTPLETLRKVVTPAGLKMIEAAYAMRDRSWTLDEWAEEAGMNIHQARNTLRAIGRINEARKLGWLPWRRHSGRVGGGRYNWIGGE